MSGGRHNRFHNRFLRRFHTKIVKSEPGSSAVDHETGKVRGAVEEPCRQYHLQQLGDNRRLWVPSNLIIPFTGIADYEQLAIQDVKNINKIYKPKTEAAKMSWREAVLVAQQLEPMVPAERVRKCDWARLREIGGPALQKKLEYDNKKREAEEEDRGRKDEGDSSASPEKFKSPSSPRKGGEETVRKEKSDQVRRKEEMDYKMFRMSSMQKKSDDKKEEKKRKRSEGSESGSPTKTPVTEPSPTVTTFNRSFKVKKEVKIKTESDNFVESKKVDGEKVEDAEEVPQSNSNGSGRGGELNSPGGVANGGVKESASSQPGGGGEGGGLGRGVAKDIETETAVEGMGEGTLVWAKMRVSVSPSSSTCTDRSPQGYSFWPCVVSRDPEGGEFVKMPADCLSKSQKKIHVLFLEYNNQRAWIQLTSIKPYKGLEDFNEQKEAASKTKIKDFEPGKRYEGQFSRAVEYAEELAQLTDDDRLEQVLLRYGWVMVDGQEDGPRKKKRRTVKPDTGCSELNRSTATDSEADKEVEQGGSPVPPRPSAVSSDRRSSAEAESRLDPTPDPPSTTLSSSKKKRTSSVIASMALNGDSSSSEGGSDTEEKRSKRSRKKVVKLVVSEDVKKKVAKAAASKPAPAAPSVPTAAAMKALAGEEEFPRVGDLVWGRMAGFPFWPCFVTRSPQGQYCRDGGKGRMSYHVQFFNWNDESGWVNSALEFDGLEPFKKIAAKKKSDKSYHPAKGAMNAKWEKAAREAEETMGLTRTERAEAYLVAYGSGGHAAAKPATPKTPTPKTPKTKAAAKSPAAPKAKPSPAPAKKAAPSPVKKRVPGPASRTGRPVVPLPKRPVAAEAPEELPEGWRVSSKGVGQTFISPDGREFLVSSCPAHTPHPTPPTRNGRRRSPTPPPPPRAPPGISTTPPCPPAGGSRASGAAFIFSHRGARGGWRRGWGY